jgi:hypothetical protein
LSGKYCATPVGVRVHPAAAIAVHAIPANTPIANLLFMLFPRPPQVLTRAEARVNVLLQVLLACKSCLMVLLDSAARARDTRVARRR